MYRFKFPWYQDLQELTDLHKELEKSPEAASCAADLKKAKVGLINLQAYMNQVDCIEFAAAINNQVKMIFFHQRISYFINQQMGQYKCSRLFAWDP